MADIQSITAVAMVRRHELDAAMAVPVVVPVRRRLHPQAYFLRLWRKQGWVAPLRVTPIHGTPLVRRTWIERPYREEEITLLEEEVLPVIRECLERVDQIDDELLATI